MNNKFGKILFVILISVGAFFVVQWLSTQHSTSPEIEVLQKSTVTSHVRDAIFWYQEDLEHTSKIMATVKIKGDALFLVTPLYEDLESKGMATEYIKTMSERATQKLIELDAYRGSVPDVFYEAKNSGVPYIFKVVVSEAQMSMFDELDQITYLFSLYDTDSGRLLWQAQAQRQANFFHVMPPPEELIADLEKKMQEANIL